MDFRFTAEQEAFRQEVREFLASEKELCEKAMREEEKGSIGHYTEELRRKAGARGLLVPSWPKEWGGLNKSHMEKYIVAEEMSYAMGLGAHGTGEGMAGPVIMTHGSDELKKEFLPRIARGEIEFALGYSEPEAGSDLAALQMRAVKNGDHYIINGQKVFNTACHYAQYHWLAARTDTTVARHKGISMFVVDMDSPGVTVSGMYGMGGVRTNEVFYDDVKVPASRLVGEENKGWDYLMAALAFERNWQMGYMIHQFENFIEYCKTTMRDGKLLIEDPVVRDEVAELATGMEIGRLFGIKNTCLIEKGEVPSWEAAIAKVFGSELWYRMTKPWMKMLNLYDQLQADSECTVMDSAVMQGYFVSGRSVITRGTNEILKNMIATRGLGLPRN